MRIVLAVTIVIAASAAAQPYDTIVAGNAGWCVPFEPAIGRALDFSGSTSYPTNVAAIAPGPNGRVLAAVVAGSGFFVAEVRPDRTLVPISSTVSGRTPFTMVADRDGRIHVLAGKVGTLDNAIVSFDAEGSLRSIFPLMGMYFTGGQYGYGSWHLAESSIDLASDQCTLFLIEDATLIRRFDVCTGKFQPDFALLYPNEAYALRVLPDGGLFVAGQDHAGYALMRFTPTGQMSQRFPVDFFVHALMLQHGGESVLYGEQGCESGKIVTLNVSTGKAGHERVTMDTPTSIVSYFGWTAALGAAHLPDAPAAGTIALGLLAISLVGFAMVRLP